MRTCLRASVGRMSETMGAGRELDAAVHDRVMGWGARLHAAKDQREYEQLREELGMCPEYSSDIAAAWEIVEKLRRSGFLFYLETEPRCSDLFAYFRRPGDPSDRISAPTAPHAICLAALRATEDK